MTLIVGIETERGVLLAGDAIACEGHETSINGAGSKVFALGPYGLGYTWTFRMGDLLRYSLRLPPPPATGLHRHLVTKVIPLLRTCFREGGMTTTKDGVELGGNFLLAVRGTLWIMQADFSVLRARHGYWACGAGMHFALGALAATGNVKPRPRAKLVMEAAAEHCMAVRAPWRMLLVPA